MPLAVKRKFAEKSERVKSVELHPAEPWVLVAMYNGRAMIWNFATGALVKTFEVAENQPVRSARFIVRKQWVVTGSDDMHIRCFNANTTERVAAFEAHTDYIRALEVRGHAAPPCRVCARPRGARGPLTPPPPPGRL